MAYDATTPFATKTALTVEKLNRGHANTVALKTAAQAFDGIKFAATQVASGDANTLDDYEEGTWTPTDGSGAGLSFTSVVGRYVKIGQLVMASFALTYPSTADGTAAKLASLPFTCLNATDSIFGGAVTYTNCALSLSLLVTNAGTTVEIYKNDGTSPTNANLSLKVLRGAIVYRANA